jgi:hypothetical protein
MSTTYVGDTSGLPVDNVDGPVYVVDMSTSATATSTVRTNSFLFFTTGNRADVLVIDTPQELIAPDGVQVVRYANTGARQFIRPTGRSVTRQGFRCPTFDRFEVDTVVRDGAIWGVPGKRIAGTVAAFPGCIV